MDTQDLTAKKRKPPTFRHLPLNRAKKLKKGWVDAQKIKSQWKAQKRKEGLVTQRAIPPHLSQVEPSTDNGPSHEVPVTNDEPSSSSDDEDVDDQEKSEGGAESESSESEAEKEEPPARTPHPSRSRGRGSRATAGTKRKHSSEQQESEEKLSLRDLTKQAYSRSSLHTYKSNPKRGSNKPSRGGDRGRGTRGRGGGQPDMRLRMNAMLEKIKRDVV